MGRLPSHIENLLREALKSAQMTNASFDHMGADKSTIVYEGNDKKGQTWPSLTDMIREKTRLYRSSWIIGPIEQILEWNEAPKDERGMDEWTLRDRLRAPFPHPAVLEEAFQEIVRLEEENAELRAFKAKVKKSLEDAS